MSWDLEDWARLATIVGAFAIPISALALWYPLHFQQRLAQVANAQVLTGLAASLNLQLVQDKEVAKYWLEGPAQFDSYGELDRFRYTQLLTWWLLLHENVFIQHENGLLEKGTYSAWQSDLAKFIADHQLAKHWPALQSGFDRKFADHIQSLVAIAAPQEALPRN
jgi:hypothetical protein